MKRTEGIHAFLWFFLQQKVSNMFSIFLLFFLFLQRVGLPGAAGQFAARSAMVAIRCAAEHASLRRMCARESLKKDVPATLSPALVSPPFIKSGALGCMLL